VASNGRRARRARGLAGVDGINVDIEQLDELDRDEYGAFLAALRTALTAAMPGARLSVATEAGLRGTGNALAAVEAGVDRLFLMGYDYHWSGSQPGASSPIDRSDGLYTLRWSIEQYVRAGVPRDRIVLGLPLYGMSWRTIGPDRTAPVLGKGSTWIPNRHLDVLLDPTFQPGRDPLEVSEFFIRPDGDAWRVTYYDSAATLRRSSPWRGPGPRRRGFWAIGYERGLPGYLELMRDFRAGNVDRAEAPSPRHPRRRRRPESGRASGGRGGRARSPRTARPSVPARASAGSWRGLDRRAGQWPSPS